MNGGEDVLSICVPRCVSEAVFIKFQIGNGECILLASASQINVLDFKLRPVQTQQLHT